MTLERRDVGFGKFQWFIDGIVTDKPEYEIIAMLTPRDEKRLFSQMNLYHNIRLEIA